MRRGGVVWGVLLILFGGYLLAVNFDLVPELAAPLWGVVFGVLSILFLGTYLASGLRHWGWLFPTLIFGALAAIITLAELNVGGEWLGSLFLWAIAVPFWVAFVLERGREWWPLIPGGVMTVVGAMPILSSVAEGEFVGAVFLLGLAAIFGLVYLVSGREHWWPLIPSGVLFVLGLITLLVGVASEDLIGAVFMLGMAGVFLAVFVLWRENWWALIPAGTLATIGVTAALATQLNLINGLQDRVMGGVFFGGLALTFLVLWLLRGRYGTAWALYPGAGLGAFAVLVVILGPRIEVIWPALLLVAGGWLLLRALRPRRV